MNDGAARAFGNWMRWHRANRAPIIATLEREHMYVEAMFRDTVGQPGVIYWLTVDGPGAQSVDGSPLAIDREHLAFMREVIRKGSRRVLTTEFSLTPPFLDSAIDRHRASNP